MYVVGRNPVKDYGHDLPNGLMYDSMERERERASSSVGCLLWIFVVIVNNDSVFGHWTTYAAVTDRV